MMTATPHSPATSPAKSTTTPDTSRERAQERTLRPLVDIYENEREFVVVADIPGATLETLSVKFDRGDLTISGGPFERVFSIPDTVDVAKIDAKLDAGVLQLTMPKTESAKPLHIPVRRA